ncbi:dTDP-4-dehydrorhamnose 3,5-epimerase [Nonlabens ulvanivorans]|uniref:dTDP-4-dehydrorhamnose 3,5-epimerase n=1 Tax=Nonlabens ulvanivorans TaxID=906888 RepID=A0A084JTZ2_NONUL|nr:dTDP-4-dehydrorhamnose 3,5-epimerase [Nonlabens ulvanivorans]KEZ92426.1 dTDP-4-dehydrorhamnose 3,5-epimerase [Nonlabens ulvanivorans]PRX15262.1 dTDP-4-dehydrorhamnose 3,5-epimerase [Nonlabens ulvanivorans]GAK98660.1 dTDP-4-dehydrorhamnose 3,5-epimerase [Nonlabens ulvanivorans]
MIVKETPLKDCYIIEPPVFGDDRGYFSIRHDKYAFAKAFPNHPPFVLHNESFSSYGVLRGLHLQKGDAAQAKLVRCVQGKILDVAVDYRLDSPTYLKHFTIELSGDNHKQLLVPRGFLHGFSVLSDTAIVNYQVDNTYQPETEFGIRYDDPTLNIDWQLPDSAVLLSEKDEKLDFLKL